jgi:hypothetical protein
LQFATMAGARMWESAQSLRKNDDYVWRIYEFSLRRFGSTVYLDRGSSAIWIAFANG